MTPNDAVEEARLAERIYLARVRQCFVHAAGNAVASVLAGVIIVAFMYQSGVASPVLYGWFALLMLASLGPVVIERQFHRATLTIETAPGWVRKRLTAGGLVGFLLGVAAFLIPDGAIVPLLILFIILTTLVSVAAIGYSTVPHYTYFLALVTLGPLNLRFLMVPDTFHLTMVVACGVWLYVYLSKARLVSRTAIESIAANERLNVEIERRRVAEDEIRHMAHHDPLTGAANRRYFEEIVELALARARRGGKGVAIVIIDLDLFKPVNDTYGHVVGDGLLKEVTARVERGIRQTDTVARIGGDEFAVVMEEMDDREAVAVATEKLARLFVLPFVVEGHALPLGASLGAALYPEDGDSLDKLTHAADVRMYEAKRRRSQDPVDTEHAPRVVEE